MKNKFFITLLTTLLAENAGFTAPASVHNVVVKFSFAMLGVVISTIAILLGLSIYNRIRNQYNNTTTEDDEILKSPKTKDDAIRFYIRKNKLQ